MTEPRGGWNVAKVLMFVLSLAGLAGFGLCSLAGAILGINERASAVLPWVLFGAVMAGFSGWFMYLIVKSAKRPPDEP